MSGIDSITLSTGDRSITLTDDQWRGVVNSAAGGPGRAGGRRLLTGGDPDEIYPIPTGRQFIDPGTMRLLDFIPAVDVELIAESLIEEHGATFGHLTHLKLTYLWKLAGGASAGKATLGQCQKATGLIRHFGKVDFIIWLAADNCAMASLTRWQIEALVFHELLHAGRDARGKPAIAPHDFDGFIHELLEYGAWEADLRRMVNAARQLPLLDAEDDDRGSA